MHESDKEIWPDHNRISLQPRTYIGWLTQNLLPICAADRLIRNLSSLCATYYMLQLASILIVHTVIVLIFFTFLRNKLLEFIHFYMGARTHIDAQLITQSCHLMWDSKTITQNRPTYSVWKYFNKSRQCFLCVNRILLNPFQKMPLNNILL